MPEIEMIRGNKMKRVMNVAALPIPLSGCATKQHARVAPLTWVEASEYTSWDIRIEKAKIQIAPANYAGTGSASRPAITSTMPRCQHGR